MKTFFAQKNKGFTVLFSVVVSALVLAIGLSIANITLKQIRISTLGRDSQVAFYAADSGSECVMYHDLINEAFATSSESDQAALPDTISCFGGEGNVEIDSLEDDSATSTITLSDDQGASGFCANVQIGKYDTNDDGYTDKTIILSRGYNLCNIDSTRLLERGIRIKY